MVFLTGHLDPEPNRNLIFKEKPSNMGIYIGNVANYNQAKGHITLNLNDNLTIGDTINFEKEETKYRISELMMGRKNIDYATQGQLITIGRMKGNIHPGDKIYKLESKSLLVKTKASYDKEVKKHPLSCDIKIIKDKPVMVKISDSNGINFHLTSDIFPNKAIKQPITEERIILQFSKTGNSPFVFEDFNITLDDHLYIKIGDLNELRRNCLEKVEKLIIDSSKREIPNYIPKDIITHSLREFLTNKTSTIKKENISFAKCFRCNYQLF